VRAPWRAASSFSSASCSSPPASKSFGGSADGYGGVEGAAQQARGRGRPAGGGRRRRRPVDTDDASSSEGKASASASGTLAGPQGGGGYGGGSSSEQSLEPLNGLIEQGEKAIHQRAQRVPRQGARPGAQVIHGLIEG
jgi:hypothetical protein